MTRKELETAEFDPVANIDVRRAAYLENKLRIEFGACSDVGKVRHNNEDHFAVIRRTRSRDVVLTNMPASDLSLPDEVSHVLIVADGMGGAAFGELASRLALRTADELMGSACGWISKLRDLNYRTTLDRIQAYADVIQEMLLECAEDDPRLAGMGTTLTCAHVLGADVIIAHVGDSRAYHLRDGMVQQVTRDQTLAQDLMDAGMSERDTRRFRHILTNCFSGERREVRITVYHLAVEAGDALLLCTDGLYDLVRDAEIAEALTECGDAQHACAHLTQLALDRGGKDNVTVVVGRFLPVADAG